MKIQVATLHHAAPHGDQITVHPSEDDANASLIEVVTLSWSNLDCENGSDCGVENCTGVPRDPDTLERDEAIRLYFAHRAGTETKHIATHEVELDTTPVAIAQRPDGAR